jgi:hypothetical protein
MSAEVTIEPSSRKPFPKRARDGDIASAEMTKSCARDLTDRIKAAVDDVAELLWRAYEGKAWMALHYGSWKEYCEKEFQFSKQHAYRLLDFVETKNLLAGSHQLVTPERESQTRPLAKLEPEEKAEAWARAVDDAGGKQPTAQQVACAVQIIEPEPEPQVVHSVRIVEPEPEAPGLSDFARKDIRTALSAGMSAAWEILKKKHPDMEWKDFTRAVQSWLNRSQIKENP